MIEQKIRLCLLALRFNIVNTILLQNMFQISLKLHLSDFNKLFQIIKFKFTF